MELSEIVLVLTRAQGGDEEAKNRLITIMQKEGYINRVAKYLRVNRLLEPDDVKAEFWFGVAKAIPQARPDIGNPLQFLSQHGVWQVVSVLRRRIQACVSFACLDCGRHGRLTRRVHTAGCPSCTSMNIQTSENITTVEDLEVFNYSYSPKPDYITEEFKCRLTVREKQALELILGGLAQGECQNYIKEISAAMGISVRRVVVYIHNLRYKLNQYLGE